MSYLETINIRLATPASAKETIKLCRAILTAEPGLHSNIFRSQAISSDISIHLHWLKTTDLALQTHWQGGTPMSQVAQSLIRTFGIHGLIHHELWQEL